MGRFYWREHQNLSRPRRTVVGGDFEFGAASPTNRVLGLTWSGLAVLYAVHRKIRQEV
jgi:hypothetical protein